MTDPLAVVEEPRAGGADVPDTDLYAAYARQLQRRATVETLLDKERSARAGERRELVTGLLDVCDALDEVLTRQLPADAVMGSSRGLERLRENIEATQRLLLQRMRRAGVERMALGAISDAERCDVVDTEDDPRRPEGTILRVVAAGYWLGDDVLRPAKVVVSRQPLETDLPTDLSAEIPDGSPADAPEEG
ncbi:nucleotide exchange factor GrpE [Yinghuangia soli]|uniref:Nucleotide exchange factor GrpE n=1 Tax=Yinghuangia soli TaxID=2908204 RepID=A0AA41U243_9ACTN|nr:nucleotide exchange factor GrpE [Yinghuangia soli]MCF2531403.1 nucleotide exchange factor GrpE [Yinghuangia soli]